jgi:DNA polymerase elongation subunit (family B)
VQAVPIHEDVPDSVDEKNNTNKVEQKIEADVQPTVRVRLVVPIRQWIYGDMESEISSVEMHNMSIMFVVMKWGIPPNSLRVWLLGITTTKRRGPPTILSKAKESDVVQWCKDMAQMGHGLRQSTSS